VNFLTTDSPEIRGQTPINFGICGQTASEFARRFFQSGGSFERIRRLSPDSETSFVEKRFKGRPRRYSNGLKARIGPFMSYKAPYVDSVCGWAWRFTSWKPGMRENKRALPIQAGAATGRGPLIAVQRLGKYTAVAYGWVRSAQCCITGILSPFSRLGAYRREIRCGGTAWLWRRIIPPSTGAMQHPARRIIFIDSIPCGPYDAPVNELAFEDLHRSCSYAA
jgi:hypothetical protein